MTAPPEKHCSSGAPRSAEHFSSALLPLLRTPGVSTGRGSAPVRSSAPGRGLDPPAGRLDPRSPPPDRTDAP
ncbi:hypothetical protein ACFSM7_11535 [Clavibacter michiganensis subsp. tessellarius]|uniref:hypothetical protein n=1 Tax=Clavibacter tessellarius TaxID=31965 RepID=UPI0036414F07